MLSLLAVLREISDCEAAQRAAAFAVSYTDPQSPGDGRLDACYPPAIVIAAFYCITRDAYDTKKLTAAVYAALKVRTPQKTYS